MCEVKKIYLLIPLIILFICLDIPTYAETIKDTNFISAAKADSTIAAVNKKLDKSIYGFYSMVCTDGFTLNYRMFKPPTVPNIKYPLVITLHGSGPEGYDNTSQMEGIGPAVWSLPEYQNRHPHYSVCPQVSPDAHIGNWKDSYAKEYIELRDSLIRMFPDIDTTRIYLTGFSSGGGITFRMLAYYPRSFAAGIAASGQIGGQTEGYAGMSDWPPIYVANNTQIWIFAGGNEGVDPNNIVNGMKAIADSISANGGNPRTTFFANLNHSQVEGMYKLEPGLFDWLFEQKREGNTDVKSDETKGTIQIFPNPSYDYISLIGSSDEFLIYNLMGEKLISIDNSHQDRIDISFLEKGIYIIRSKNIFYKLIKL